MGRCSCGHLDRYAQDPKVPITYHPDTQTYSLDLCDEVSVPNIFCPFCGGRQWPDGGGPPLRCDCGSLGTWASDPKLPINFDASLNEYHLITHSGRYAKIFYFCPACGRRTPESRRGELFTEPLQGDVDELMGRLRGAKTIAQVIDILGEPDQRAGPLTHSREDKAIYGYRDTKQSLVYTSLSPSACLFVQEYEDSTMFCIG